MGVKQIARVVFQIIFVMFELFSPRLSIKDYPQVFFLMLAVILVKFILSIREGQAEYILHFSYKDIRFSGAIGASEKAIFLCFLNQN